jgi:hypothetical protein
VQISTFGKILYWITKQLEEVRVDMVKYRNGSEEIANNISLINHLISHVLKSTQTNETLQEKFSQIPETEYRELVEMIQNNEIDMTDELREGTNRLLDGIQHESPETIQLAKILLEKMHSESYRQGD